MKKRKKRKHPPLSFPVVLGLLPPVHPYCFAHSIPFGHLVDFLAFHRIKTLSLSSSLNLFTLSVVVYRNSSDTYTSLSVGRHFLQASLLYPNSIFASPLRVLARTLAPASWEGDPNLIRSSLPTLFSTPFQSITLRIVLCMLATLLLTHIAQVP